MKVKPAYQRTCGMRITGLSLGIFLISRSNTDEFVGNCVIVEDITKRLMLSDKILRIEYLAGINKWYILYAMRTRFIREQIISIATGTSASMKNISRMGFVHYLYRYRL